MKRPKHVPSKVIRLAAYAFAFGVASMPSALAQNSRPAVPRALETNAEVLVLPNEVALAIKRAEVCHYLAEELGDSDLRRDQEVNKALERNRCTRVGKDLQRLEAKYKKSAAILLKLQAAE